MYNKFQVFQDYHLELPDCYFDSCRKFAELDQNLESGFHLHHIVPVCCGGKDEDINTIKVSTSHHLELHKLITKEKHMSGERFRKLKNLYTRMVKDPNFENKLTIDTRDVTIAPKGGNTVFKRRDGQINYCGFLITAWATFKREKKNRKKDKFHDQTENLISYYFEVNKKGSDRLLFTCTDEREAKKWCRENKI